MAPGSTTRRPVSLVLVTATVLGLWFGLTAPDVSPVAPPAAAVAPDDGPRRGGPR